MEWKRLSWGGPSSNWDLPITSCQVQSQDVSGLPYMIDEVIYPGHWIGITHGNLVESPVVHTES